MHQECFKAKGKTSILSGSAARLFLVWQLEQRGKHKVEWCAHVRHLFVMSFEIRSFHECVMRCRFLRPPIFRAVHAIACQVLQNSSPIQVVLDAPPSEWRWRQGDSCEAPPANWSDESLAAASKSGRVILTPEESREVWYGARRYTS